MEDQRGIRNGGFQLSPHPKRRLLVFVAPDQNGRDGDAFRVVQQVLVDDIDQRLPQDRRGFAEVVRAESPIVAFPQSVRRRLGADASRGGAAGTCMRSVAIASEAPLQPLMPALFDKDQLAMRSL